MTERAIIAFIAGLGLCLALAAVVMIYIDWLQDALRPQRKERKMRVKENGHG